MNENLKKQLEEIDKTSVIKRLKSLLDIKERNETKVKITQECVDKIKKYLLMWNGKINVDTKKVSTFFVMI